MIFTAKRILAGIALAAAGCASCMAQATASPAFDLADVHVSAHTTTPEFTGGSLRGDRYVLHNATLLDMISLAYDMQDDNILSGPAWLEINRFDVSAHAPRGTSAENVRLMLQGLLAERFHLVVHPDTHPLPAFVLSVGKGSKLKESDGTASSECGDDPSKPATPPGAIANIYVSCHNLTGDQIAQNLHEMAGGYLTNQVVNHTGLKGSWDFNLHWTGRGNLAKTGSDGISIFDAVDKQLGLKLEAKTAPVPVLIVDKADDKPTPNVAGLDTMMPPAPPAEFDVAVLTPSKPDARLGADFTPNQIKATGVTPQFFIAYAWNINPGDDELIQNGPKWLKDDKWDLLGKASPESQSIGPDGKPQFDFDLLPHMVQTMLAERFGFKYHMEDRLVSAFSLVAAGPHMKTADPLGRTGCKEGPGPDGKDPRVANPILGRLVYCRNMSMAQLANQLPSLAGGYIFLPVADSTGLPGGYDFTLSFSTSGQLQSSAPASTAAANATDSGDSSASNPNGGLSLGDAMARQLGIKLVKEKRLSPVLVIDHIDEKPTEN